MNRLVNIFALGLLFMYSCESFPQASESEKEIQQPNILWLIAEDMSPYLAAFGDSTIRTPNIDRLAAEGVRYTQVYSPSGVCAPSRAALATGMYPSSIGANHMRTNSFTEVTGLPPYEAVPPAEVKMFNEWLRQQGYFCTNNSKEDYQFKAPLTAWDENGPFAHWRNRNSNQAFFSVFSFMTTHESGLFEPYGMLKNEKRLYQAGDTTYQLGHPYAKTPEAETPIHIASDTIFPIPPYLPDNEVVRRDLWKMYNNIAEMDKQIGAILDQLEEDGLLETTFIFFFADHGGPLPRQKRLIYDSGLRVPMIIRYPDKKFAGSIDEQLISFVDFAPTVLKLADVSIPGYMQGQTFIDNDKSERKYIHAAADRFDAFTDVIRAVRDNRFKYIRNYRPDQGYYLPVSFRERIPTMAELLRLKDEGELNETQSLWFRDKKEPEELYDCINDPHELNNLAASPEYKEKLEELSKEMDRWLEEISDNPGKEERDLISELWKGATEQPQTADPEYNVEGGRLHIRCKTDGASIAYKLKSSESGPWKIYKDPIEVLPGTDIEIKAHRIGYLSSNTLTFSQK
ncbi:MAG: sulfatase [Bacteroidota bacterium]